MRLPVGLASPSALTVYGAALDMRDVLFVARQPVRPVPDLVDSLTVAHAHGAMLPCSSASPHSEATSSAPARAPTCRSPLTASPSTCSPILEILPLQRLARRLALDRGIDPDRPRGLSKVTQTL